MWLPNLKDCDSGKENKRKQKIIIISNQISNFCYIPPGGNPMDLPQFLGENHSLPLSKGQWDQANHVSGKWEGDHFRN